jgi:hypothetical protein
MTDPISDPAPTLRRDPIERASSSRAHRDLLILAYARATNRAELFTHVASRRRPTKTPSRNPSTHLHSKMSRIAADPNPLCTELSKNLTELVSRLLDDLTFELRDPVQDGHRYAASDKRKQQRPSRPSPCGSLACAGTAYEVAVLDPDDT